MWIPPQTTTPPLPTARSASGTSEPTGAKTNAASSGSGGISSGIPRPGRPQLPGEGLPAGVPGPGEAVYLSALVHCHLGDDVRSRPEAVDAEPLDMLTSHAVGAVPDQPCAQQRRDLDILLPTVQRVAEGRGATAYSANPPSMV